MLWTSPRSFSEISIVLHNSWKVIKSLQQETQNVIDMRLPGRPSFLEVHVPLEILGSDWSHAIQDQARGTELEQTPLLHILKEHIDFFGSTPLLSIYQYNRCGYRYTTTSTSLAKGCAQCWWQYWRGVKLGHMYHILPSYPVYISYKEIIASIKVPTLIHMIFMNLNSNVQKISNVFL